MMKNDDYYYEDGCYRDSSLGTPMFSKAKQINLFLSGWLGFQIIATLLQFIALLIYSKSGMSSSEILSQYNVSMAINSGAYIILTILLFSISGKDSWKLAKSFAQPKSYVAGILCFATIFIFDIVYANILRFIKINIADNVNQTAVVSLTDLYPTAALIVFGFLGPICEELTYRVGLFSLCKRKSRVVAYVVTMVVFSFIHFNFTYDLGGLINEFLNLPFYCFAALAFSYAYDNYGFAGSATAHVINNVISVLLIRVII